MGILRSVGNSIDFTFRAMFRRDREYYSRHPDSYENAVLTLNKRQILAQEIGNLVDIYFPDKNPEVILDTACGTGIITHELAKHGKRVIGLDCSTGALDYARQTKNQGIEFRHGDFLNLPLDDSTVDVYTMSHAYRFIGKEQNRFYQEIARVLKSGGIAIIPRGLGDNSFYSLSHGENHVRKYAQEIGLSMESFRLRYQKHMDCWRLWVFRKDGLKEKV